VAVLAIMAGAIVSFSLLSGQIGSINEVRANVEQNGDLVLQRITYAIQEADYITSPAEGTVSESILLVKVTNESPFRADETFIHVHNGAVRIIEMKDTAAGEEREVSYLTSKNQVSVERILFFNAGGDVRKSISFAFAVANQAVGIDVGERQYTKIFRGTTSLHARIACSGNTDCNMGAGERCCGSIGFCVNTGGDACPCITSFDCEGLTCTEECTEKLGSCVLGECEETVLDSACNVCEFCGDENQDPGEECDDGRQCGDGTQCTAHSQCTGFSEDLCVPRDDDSCSRYCQLTLCGDGSLNSDRGEECDDGNNTSGDGCSVECLEEMVQERGV